MTHKTLFDQNKLVFQKLDAIVIPELVLKWPKFHIIIGSLRFILKLMCKWLFKKRKFLLEFSHFGYFFRLLVKIFYIPLVDYMYYLMCKVFFCHKFAYFLDLRPF